MHLRAGALCVIALVSVPGAASAQVIPLADCVTEGSSPGLTQALFGYRNPESAAVVVPVGRVMAIYVGGLRAGDDGRRGHKGEGHDERKSLQPPAVTDIDEGQITILAVPHKRIRYVVFK